MIKNILFVSNKNKSILLIFIFILVTPNVAHAYIDPGTTSLIISAIVSAIAVTGYYFRLIIQKIKEIIQKIKEIFTNKNK